MHRPLVFGLAAVAVLPFSVHAQSRFVGVKTCARCHQAEPESPFHLWQASKHAGAYRTLQTHSESEPRKCRDLDLWIVEIGRGVRYGLPRPAPESRECLPCHTTAFGLDRRLVAPSFDPKDGVQCESCHGPGSAHAESAALEGANARAGLRRFPDERAVQALCRTCHEGTCGDFDFARMWPKVKHTPAPRR